MGGPLIQFQKVKKSFQSAEGTKHILADVSLDVEKGSITTLFGPNGCGKTTLMNLLIGFDNEDSGAILGREALVGKIGTVFQDYRKTLLPWRTAAQNIALPLEFRGYSSKRINEKIEELVALTEVPFDLNQRVFTLSGGQAQLVNLLRALVIEPELLILDEPFSALDYERTLDLRQKVLTIATRLSLTVLFICHDLDEAIYLGDSVVFLSRSPTRVIKVLSVPFGEIREPKILASSEFARLKGEALSVFSDSLN